MSAEVFIISAPDWRPVLVMVGALEWMIACRMTAQASRMRQQFSDLGKNRPRACWLVSNRFEF
jgi:hypothetical protein